MTSHVLRRALLAAVNAAFDVIENADGVDPVPTRPPPALRTPPRRRAPARPPAMPSQPPSELDREAARQELRRMGVKVPR